MARVMGLGCSSRRSAGASFGSMPALTSPGPDGLGHNFARAQHVALVVTLRRPAPELLFEPAQPPLKPAQQ